MSLKRATTPATDTKRESKASATRRTKIRHGKKKNSEQQQKPAEWYGKKSQTLSTGRATAIGSTTQLFGNNMRPSLRRWLPVARFIKFAKCSTCNCARKHRLTTPARRHLSELDAKHFRIITELLRVKQRGSNKLRDTDNKERSIDIHHAAETWLRQASAG